MIPLIISAQPLNPSRLSVCISGRSFVTICENYIHSLTQSSKPSFFNNFNVKRCWRWTLGPGQWCSVCVFNKLNVRQGNIWDDPSPAALWASYKHKQMTWTWWSQPTLAIMETRNILTREKKTMHRLSVVSLFMPRSGVRCSFRCSCL